MNPHISIQFPTRINRDILFRPVVTQQSLFPSDSAIVDEAIRSILEHRKVFKAPRRAHNSSFRHKEAEIPWPEYSLYLLTLTNIERMISSLLNSSSPKYSPIIPSLSKSLAMWLCDFYASPLLHKKGLIICSKDAGFRKNIVLACISAVLSVRNDLPAEHLWIIPEISTLCNPARYILVSHPLKSLSDLSTPSLLNRLKSHYNLLSISTPSEITLISR